MNLHIKDTKLGKFLLIKEDSISNTITHTGSWEPWLSFLYSKFIQKDFTCIDVGANIGYHTIGFSKLCTNGFVYSFEPQKEIFNILSANIALNNSSQNVLQYRDALGDKAELMQFNKIEDCKEKNSSLINWGGRKIVTNGSGEGSLQTKTLDSFDFSKVDFIKLDVEGFEVKFLDGATQTIESNKPIIFFENYAWHEDYENDRKVIAKLKLFGYTIYRLTVTSYKEDCIALHPNKHEKEINLLTSQTDIPYTKE